MSRAEPLGTQPEHIHGSSRVLLRTLAGRTSRARSFRPSTTVRAFFADDHEAMAVGGAMLRFARRSSVSRMTAEKKLSFWYCAEISSAYLRE